MATRTERSQRLTLIGLILAGLAAAIVPVLWLPQEAAVWVAMAAALAVIVVYARLFRGALGLRPAIRPARTIALGIALGMGLFLLFKLLLEPGIEILTGQARDLSRFDPLRGDPALLARTLVMIWITAAFFEELYFRGFLIGALARLFGSGRGAWAGAVVISATLFALAHGYQGIAGVVVTWLGAAILGFLFARWRNLWVLIIAHGLFDTGSAVLLYLDRYRAITGVLFGD